MMYNYRVTYKDPRDRKTKETYVIAKDSTSAVRQARAQIPIGSTCVTPHRESN